MKQSQVQSTLSQKDQQKKKKQGTQILKKKIKITSKEPVALVSTTDWRIRELQWQCMIGHFYVM